MFYRYNINGKMEILLEMESFQALIDKILVILRGGCAVRVAPDPEFNKEHGSSVSLSVYNKFVLL